MACAGTGDVVETLFTGLRNLECRGYGSAGTATLGDHDVTVVKQKEGIEERADALELSRLTGQIAIGHTRRSTHGSPTDANAPSHMDCTDQVPVVHTGIFENDSVLREELALSDFPPEGSSPPRRSSSSPTTSPTGLTEQSTTRGTWQRAYQ